MSRYTKREREEAWLICAVAASLSPSTRYRDIAAELGIVGGESALLDYSNVSLDLALLCSVSAGGYFDRTQAVSAEAAQLIAEGWEP